MVHELIENDTSRSARNSTSNRRWAWPARCGRSCHPTQCRRHPGARRRCARRRVAWHSFRCPTRSSASSCRWAWLARYRCLGIRWFAPLESLLPTLKELYLADCRLEDLPPEVCGEAYNENVLAEVRAHYEDLKAGQRRDAEVKVLFLGNGGTGKTQLCRRLRGELFDASVPTTHGIQLSVKTMELENFPEPMRLNLWDFGGQEVYHGSHALFLQGQAVFLILWTPKLEQGSDCEGGLTLQRRPLRYWLDYLRAFAGRQSSALIARSQCDSPRDRVSHPPATTDDLAFFRKVEVSALTGLGLGLLGETLKEAVRDCLYRRPPPPIGLGRVRVRDRLRQLLAEDQKGPTAQRRHRLLERADFDRLCVVPIDIGWNLKDPFCHPNSFEQCSFCAGFHWH